jgi:hypothetical protein
VSVAASSGSGASGPRPSTDQAFYSLMLQAIAMVNAGEIEHRRLFQKLESAPTPQLGRAVALNIVRLGRGDALQQQLDDRLPWLFSSRSIDLAAFKRLDVAPSLAQALARWWLQSWSVEHHQKPIAPAMMEVKPALAVFPLDEDGQSQFGATISALIIRGLAEPTQSGQPLGHMLEIFKQEDTPPLLSACIERGVRTHLQKTLPQAEWQQIICAHEAVLQIPSLSDMQHEVFARAMQLDLSSLYAIDVYFRESDVPAAALRNPFGRIYERKLSQLDPLQAFAQLNDQQSFVACVAARPADAARLCMGFIKETFSGSSMIEQYARWAEQAIQAQAAPLTADSMLTFACRLHQAVQDNHDLLQPSRNLMLKAFNLQASADRDNALEQIKHAVPWDKRLQHMLAVSPASGHKKAAMG